MNITHIQFIITNHINSISYSCATTPIEHYILSKQYTHLTVCWRRYVLYGLNTNNSRSKFYLSSKRCPLNTRSKLIKAEYNLRLLFYKYFCRIFRQIGLLYLATFLVCCSMNSGPEGIQPIQYNVNLFLRQFPCYFILPAEWRRIRVTRQF